MEREKQWDRLFLQDEKYSSTFAQWKSSAGREDLTCWRKGEEARGTRTGTAVGGSLDSPSVEMGREGEHAGVGLCRWDLWKFSPNCPNYASEVGTEAVSHE